MPRPIDYQMFADDEAYLFRVVSPRFVEQGWLGAFDLMAIARWKAQRARIHFARRLVCRGAPTLEVGARTLTKALAKAATAQERFTIVCGDWGFPLPTGSALLTVCYPAVFTVYDIRVCTELDAFHNLAARTKVSSLWAGYTDFVDAVRRAAPEGINLRDADRWLWGRSRYRDLRSLVTSFTTD